MLGHPSTSSVSNVMLVEPVEIGVGALGAASSAPSTYDEKSKSINSIAITIPSSRPLTAG